MVLTNGTDEESVRGPVRHKLVAKCMQRSVAELMLDIDTDRHKRRRRLEWLHANGDKVRGGAKGIEGRRMGTEGNYVVPPPLPPGRGGRHSRRP